MDSGGLDVLSNVYNERLCDDQICVFLMPKLFDKRFFNQEMSRFLVEDANENKTIIFEGKTKIRNIFFYNEQFMEKVNVVQIVFKLIWKLKLVFTF